MGIKTFSKGKLNLRQLLADEKENIATLLKRAADLLAFQNEVSLYNNESYVIASTSTQPSQLSVVSCQLSEQENYCEIEEGWIFKFVYQENCLGFIFIQKDSITKEKVFNLANVIGNFLNEIIKLKLEKKELLQEILSNYREINLLYKFSGNISTHLDLDYVLKSVLMESKNVISADTYDIQLVDKKTNALQTKIFLGNACPSSNQTHPDKVIARMVAKTGIPQIVNDTKEKQKIKDCQCGINSIIGIPLKTKEEIYGVIVLSSRMENRFTARDEKLLFSLATQAAIAIENYHLEKINWENRRQLALKTIINEEQEKEYKDFLGLSFQMATLKNKIPVDDPVSYLIYGEYGVGKKLLARYIHRKSKRKNGPFIPVDCAIFSSSPLNYKLLLGSGTDFKQKKLEVDFSYLELAEGGTLFLQNVDRLPKELGEKLSELISSKDVRIAAETSVSLDKKAEKGEFDLNLYKILTKNTVFISPLRERKKDIVRLTEYFIKKYSNSLGKKIEGVDSKAYEKLLNYHYQLGNIKELKQVIERACILTESNIISSDYIFLGMPTTQTKFCFNLLNLKPINYLVKKGLFPHPLAYVSSLFVLLIFYFAFFGNNKFTENPGTFFAWSLWWPFFILSIFFFGRFWCSICPINEYGIILRKIKHFNLQIPSFIVNNAHYFATIGFLLVLWIEEAFLMRHSAFRTGIIMGTIFSVAATINILFPRHTYCRYICPLGWAAGFFSFFSIIELRANPNICANKCKTHDCFKGNEQVEGCPMFLHPQFVDTNLSCKLCFRCVRLCPNDSLQLNLRLPGWDIASSEHHGNKTSLLIPALLSVPYAIVMFASKRLSHYYSFLNFTLIFWALPVIIGFTIWTINYTFYGHDKKNSFENFLNALSVYIPLALTAHVSLQLAYIPIFPKINVNANLLGTGKIFSFSLLGFSQTIILLSGLIFSFFLMHIRASRFKEKQPIFYRIGHKVVMAIYCLSFLNFLLY
ncbi:MAG: sigma 54-interacting transcriptional regulator [bacterium]